jgi:hypothetical protein
MSSRRYSKESLPSALGMSILLVAVIALIDQLVSLTLT